MTVSGIEHLFFQNGTGTRCWVSGWGADSIGGKYANTLKKVHVPIVGNDKCQPAIRQALLDAGKKVGNRLTLQE